MPRRWLIGLVLCLFLLSSSTALCGPVKIHLQGTLTSPSGQRTFDGDYPVTIRLWNGGKLPILTVDTVLIHVVKGRFLTHIGPYAALTREVFSTQKSLSFQLPDEPEISPRTRFERMAASGEIYCSDIRLTTSSMPVTNVGTRIRIGFASDKSTQTGVLLALSREVIDVLDLSRPGVVNRYQFDSVTSFEISVRHRRHGQIGFIAGMAVGAFAGYAMGEGETDDVSMSKETKRAFDAFAGAILGGLTGYLMGNSITTDRWQSLPLDRLRNRVRSEDEFMARTRQ